MPIQNKEQLKRKKKPLSDKDRLELARARSKSPLDPGFSPTTGRLTTGEELKIEGAIAARAESKEISERIIQQGVPGVTEQLEAKRLARGGGTEEQTEIPQQVMQGPISAATSSGDFAPQPVLPGQESPISETDAMLVTLTNLGLGTVLALPSGAYQVGKTTVASKAVASKVLVNQAKGKITAGREALKTIVKTSIGNTGKIIAGGAIGLTAYSTFSETIKNQVYKHENEIGNSETALGRMEELLETPSQNVREGIWSAEQGYQDLDDMEDMIYQLEQTIQAASEHWRFKLTRPDRERLRAAEFQIWKLRNRLDKRRAEIEKIELFGLRPSTEEEEMYRIAVRALEEKQKGGMKKR